MKYSLLNAHESNFVVSLSHKSERGDELMFVSDMV